MHQLTRRDDWRGRFAAEMDRQRRVGFAWGKQDCALGLVCGAVQAITGADLARGYRGKYRSPRAALKLLGDSGADNLGDFAALHLPEIHPSQARVGDLGILAAEGPIGEAFCIVDASGVIVMTEQGHGRLPRADMTRAFKVG
ncbi:DUF6950 family protein [Paracoccus methylarcula]|uniref:DUF6950 domain-containing protein n=1 Tax=Paracoccus methylarcula TaxID=72022 RepID=A0A422QZG3_9RHOB|nr:hypothetical protein [Paracoccus methylarcula]RNF35385.1 hypothetical protein A7A09_007305 [Paracoccus methylarcula]